MGKYVMVVQSQAKPGRDDEYNQWYDSVHFGTCVRHSRREVRASIRSGAIHDLYRQAGSAVSRHFRNRGRRPK